MKKTVIKCSSPEALRENDLDQSFRAILIGEISINTP